VDYGDNAVDRIVRCRPHGPWHRPADEVPDDTETTTRYVVVFNPAQPPEVEVQGRFLGELRDRLDGERDRMAAFLLTADYRRRTGDDRRVEERIRTWQRVARDADITLIVLDREREGMIEKLEGALWPPRDTGPVEVGA